MHNYGVLLKGFSVKTKINWRFWFSLYLSSLSNRNKKNASLLLLLFSMCMYGLWFDCNTFISIYSWLAPGFALSPYKASFVVSMTQYNDTVRRSGCNPMIYYSSSYPNFRNFVTQRKIQNNNCFNCLINNVTLRLFSVHRSYYLYNAHLSKNNNPNSYPRFNGTNAQDKKLYLNKKFAPRY